MMRYTVTISGPFRDGVVKYVDVAAHSAEEALEIAKATYGASSARNAIPKGIYTSPSQLEPPRGLGLVIETKFSSPPSLPTVESPSQNYPYESF
jgi:hypothetical protein